MTTGTGRIIRSVATGRQWGDKLPDEVIETKGNYILDSRNGIG